MQGKENWPGNQATSEADVTENLEVAKEEEAIKRAMIKDMGIGSLEERLDPIEPTVGQCRGGCSGRELEAWTSIRAPALVLWWWLWL